MDFLQRLSQFLDRPLFPWKRLVLGFSLGQFVFESFLTFRQYRVLQSPKPPRRPRQGSLPRRFRQVASLWPRQS
ncbi:uncharacterized protein TrAtP1_011566 [Trichoderma atroviride]|uniref:uncharacterized protein n=1 Tax=Hypocrea atroviridis TaxID=63577 RepID=UPI00331753A2|nr:hypothetical protein TrAtP1_011566 [Trichoderma atroviride]